MTYLVKLGTYTFPPGFKPVSFQADYDAAESEHPRGHGAVSQMLRKKHLRVSIAGSVMGSGGGITAIQSTVDAIRTAVEQLGPQKLYFGRSDRYIWAQVASAPEDYQGSAQGGSWYGAAHDLNLSFLCPWPFFLDAAGPALTTLPATGGTVASGGNAPTYATWTVTITTGGTGLITLANTTTGETAVLSGTFANGDVIVLTRGISVPSSSGGLGVVYSVTQNGTANPALLLGRIPALAAGNNTITASTSGGIVLTSVQASANAQWNS